MFKRFKRRELPEFLKVPWGARDVLVLILVWFGAQVVLGLGLVGLGRFVPAVARFLDGARAGDITASFILNLAGIAIGLVIVAIYLYRYKVGWPAVGWRRVGVLKGLKYIFLIMFGFVILANLVLALVKLIFPGFNIDQPQTSNIIAGAHAHRALAFVALVLLPPIFEETIFRGFIFPALSKRTGIIWGAVLSSAIFGVAHGQANLFVYTLVLGLLLCFMYRRLGSIIPGIFVHMLNNYLAFLVLSGK